ncbi:hypothetical protein L218DRAFT_889372 [Marasmius fiardii PR-910]|nr:hypothetical protein L218DRAFT_889372 [Marasmius fiardii PR-910]
MSSLSNLLNPVNRKLHPMSPSESPVPILSQPPSSPESTASEEIPPTHRRRHLHQQQQHSPDDLYAEEDHDMHAVNLEADGDEDGRLRGDGHGLGRRHHHHRHPPTLAPEREQEPDREQLEEDEQDDPPERGVEVEIDPELQQEQEQEPEDITEDHDQDPEQDPDMPDIQDHGLPHVPNIPHNPDHRPHPNCPDTLACLPDTEGRPQHTLPVILRCAILGSPRKRLTIREIYAAMEGKYAYYRTAGQTWKQSVRHHLSLNRLFERQPRPVTDPGFGSYWTVNLAAPPGTKRPRKRGRPNKNKEGGAAAGTGTRPQPRTPASAGAAPLAVKELDLKRRGRPRKDSEPPPLTGSSSGATNSDILMHGRSEDELIESDEERNANQIMHPFERRSSLVGLTPYPTGGGGGGAGAGAGGGGGPGTGSESSSPTFDSGNAYATIEKLQNEIASLRQQANDAVQLSIRLSDQLAQAHAEASRAKTNLRNVETLLEEEASKRMDAERLCVEEGKMKREAQDMLRVAEVRRREVEERWLASSRDPGMET